MRFMFRLLEYALLLGNTLNLGYNISANPSQPLLIALETFAITSLLAFMVHEDSKEPEKL